jgi:hypothetical protein
VSYELTDPKTNSKQKCVTLGGDSACLDGHDLTLLRSSKVFTRGDIVFGYVGEFRPGQIIEYLLVVPKHPKGLTTEEYIYRHLVPAIKLALDENGWERDIEIDEPTSDELFLIGYQGKLFEITSPMAVLEPSLPFASIGCGCRHAMGAMMYISHFVDSNLNDGTKFQIEGDAILFIKKILTISSMLSSGVHPPFTCKTVRSKV